MKENATWKTANKSTDTNTTLPMLGFETLQFRSEKEKESGGKGHEEEDMSRALYPCQLTEKHLHLKQNSKYAINDFRAKCK